MVEHENRDEIAIQIHPTVIADRFIIERELASGGMGTIYLAKQLPLRRTVALKVMKPEMADNDVLKERFLREAIAISSLRHPNNITLFDFGVNEDGALYIAMEYFEGRALRQLLDRHGALPVRRSLRIIAQVLMALSEAHRNNIIHRDLKPGNILIGDLDGQPDFVKVIDYGLALLQMPGGKRLTDQGRTCGTLEYMSPEQAMGEEVSPRSDLFTVALVLHEMIEGRLPAGGLAQLISLERPWEKEMFPMRDEVPKELQKILRRCFAQRPENRPKTAESLMGMLKKSTPWGQRAFDPPTYSISGPLSEHGTPARPRTGQSQAIEKPLLHLQPTLTDQSEPSTHLESPSAKQRARRSARLRIALSIAAGSLLVLLVVAIHHC